MEAIGIAAYRVEEPSPQGRVAEIVILPGRVNEDILHARTSRSAPTYYGQVTPPNRSMSSGRQLIIHEVHRPPAPLLRYVDQVAPEESSDIKFRFSRSVLTDFDVDVVHVLESQIDTLLGTKHAGPLQRLFAAEALARNLRKHGIALVRTLPGVSTDVPTSRSLAQRVLDKATTVFVVLHQSTPTPDPARTTVIPHAHYRERLNGYPRAEMVVGRILCITRGQLPSSAQALTGVARATAVPGITLRFAGEMSESLESAVRSAVARHPATVSWRPELLSDGARAQEIDAAELVVVPEVTSIGDLQTVFLALTLNRPVITPRSLQMVALAGEVGSHWIYCTDGPVTAASVDEAFAAIRERPAGTVPGLEGRAVSTITAMYAAVFRRAAVRAR